MLKKAAIFIVLAIVLTLFGAIIYSVLQPREFLWYPSYSKYGKQPYDTYVFYEQLHNFFPEGNVRKLPDGIFGEYFREEMMDIDTLIDDEYEYIVDSSAFLLELDEYEDFNLIGLAPYFYLDNLETKALLQHIYQGNNAIIAAEGVSDLLLKMIGVSIVSDDASQEDNALADEELNDRFTLQYREAEPVKLKPYEYFSYISAYPDSAKVIATNARKEVLGVEIAIGKGKLILFTMPVLFTNYYLLKQDTTIIANLIRELPDKTTYWAKSLENNLVNYNDNNKSLMSFIHSEKSLTWAFYTLIFGGLLFLILQLRRVERAIPHLERPKNISLNFIESVSALFFLHKDNRELVRKKMSYFLDRIRTQYHMDTQVVDETFINLLARKMKVKPALLALIFNLYNEYTAKPSVTNEEFLRFNKLLQTFKQNA